MFCPKCSAYLTEKDLYKTDVKYAPGNVPIEYIATCPNCRVEMGRISWGHLTISPELEIELKKAEAAKEAAAAAEAATTTAAPAASAATPNPASATKTCPHCGKPLPENY